MNKMFYECESFNQNISNWDISKVKYFEDMFSNCNIEKNTSQNSYEITKSIYTRKAYN